MKMVTICIQCPKSTTSLQILDAFEDEDISAIICNYYDKITSIPSGKEDDEIFVLRIEKNARMLCSAQLLVSYIIETIDHGGFDMLCLDEFKGIANLYRLKRLGLDTYCITSENNNPLFETIVDEVKSLNNVEQRQPKGERSNSNTYIMAGAIFGLIILVGGCGFVYSRREDRGKR